MIKIEHLTKSFRTIIAVNDLTLTVDTGDIYGFIGPNGAGKTTTIKLLATLLKPTAGTAYIDGLDITKDQEEIRGIIGYMPDFFGVYDGIKVWEYLDFFAGAYRVPNSRRGQIIDDVLELTDLQTKRESFVDELSRGVKQRLCVAKTLVHNPQVLLLDEPASGLDPRARIEIRELLKELKKMGKTIFISSHILTELADFCNTVGIIEQGKLVVSGDIAEIMAQIRGGRVIEIRVLEDTKLAERILKANPEVVDLSYEDDTIKVKFAGDIEGVAQLLGSLVNNQIKVVHFEEEPADLEDIFMRLTKGIVT